MILAFDLDDTLYDESSFVQSGLRAVAAHGASHFGLDPLASYSRLQEILQAEGRGQIFDSWLREHRLCTRGRVQECVKVYRHHRPDIVLYPAARRILERYRPLGPLYLVTDGHKIAQANKVTALALWSEFRRVFITHRFGVANAKPSLHCFERIRADAGCAYEDLVYVGDNPTKDFVSLNRRGALTIRVRTGAHRDLWAAPGYDALVSIGSLDALPLVLEQHFEGGQRRESAKAACGP